MRPQIVTVPAALGTALAALRWVLQGGGNLYSDGSREAYVPDPVAGYRLVESGPLWLGLDIVAGLAVTTAAVGAATWWLARSESRVAMRRRLRPVAWVVSIAALVPAIAAFASGSLPDDAVLTRPQTTVEAPTGGITASLTGLSAGRYTVQGEHPATAVVASVSAGGETFETRFGGVQGELSGDPGDLTAPLPVSVRLDATTVDTGVELRSKHALEYLQTDSHPTISLTIDALQATQRSADGTLSYAAEGSLAFIDTTLTVAVTGTLTALDEAARTARKVQAREAMLVTAAFAVPIDQTALRKDASDFSADQIPIAVSLLLTKP